jgi:hypothetical protein
MTQDTHSITLSFTPESLKELERMAQDEGCTIPVVIANALALYKLAKNKTVLLKNPDSKETFEIRRSK